MYKVKSALGNSVINKQHSDSYYLEEIGLSGRDIIIYRLALELLSYTRFIAGIHMMKKSLTTLDTDLHVATGFGRTTPAV